MGGSAPALSSTSTDELLYSKSRDETAYFCVYFIFDGCLGVFQGRIAAELVEFFTCIRTDCSLRAEFWSDESGYCASKLGDYVEIRS